MTHVIALIGPSGVGKSTIGARLAERLHVGFVDLDQRIEAVSGRSIPELFAAGEPHFRDLEEWTLRGLCASTVPLVVATGAGVVERAGCRESLRQCNVVYLSDDLGAVWDRLQADRTERPIASDHAAWHARMTGRLAWYEAAADLTVEIGGRSPQGVTDAVESALTR